MDVRIEIERIESVGAKEMTEPECGTHQLS